MDYIKSNYTYRVHNKITLKVIRHSFFIHIKCNQLNCAHNYQIYWAHNLITLEELRYTGQVKSGYPGNATMCSTEGSGGSCGGGWWLSSIHREPPWSSTEIENIPWTSKENTQ